MTAAVDDDTAPAPIDRGTALLGFAVVVLANLRYLAGLSALLDPLVSMEPFYIRMAQQPVADILREPPAWGPLYALWLKPFVAALGEPLAVQAAGAWALSLAVTSVVYLHLLQHTRRAALATGGALFVLISDGNVPLAGKTSSFALLVLLGGWGLAWLAPRGARRGAAMAVAALLASYARPELFPAALGLALLSLWRARREPRAALAAPLAALALIAALGATLGVPSAGGDRLFAAVREHFAWNWGAWSGEWRFFGSVWEQQFGAARSLGEALRANPAAALHHLASNLAGSARHLLGGAFRHVPLLAPAVPLGIALEAWLAALAVLAVLAAAVARPTARRRLIDRHGELLLAGAIVAAPCVAAAVVVYPRPHYLLIPWVLLLSSGLLALAALLPAPAARGWPLRLLAAVGCLAAVPRPFVLPTAYAAPGVPYMARITVDRSVADTLAVLRGLPLPRPAHVLTLTDGLGELLGPGYEEVRMWEKGDQPLADYLRDRHVDVIVTMRVGHESFVVRDDLWLLIQNDPTSVGFTPVPVPGHPEVGIFVRATPPEPR